MMAGVAENFQHYREILGWFRRRIVTLAKAGISSGEGDADRTRPRLSLG
jgi:hypothetical protein